MSWRVAVPWRRWLPVLLLLAACVPIFGAWLAPGNIVSWLSLMSFCS